MKLALLPIKEKLSDNPEFACITECVETLEMTVQFFARIGYSHPWIGYFAVMDGKIVGTAAFKGRPLLGIVEIAYGTFESCRNQGIGTAICRSLVEVAMSTDPTVIVTARTLRKENFSTRILRKNNFVKTGVVRDPEDGKVWEWVYSPKGA